MDVEHGTQFVADFERLPRQPHHRVDRHSAEAKRAPTTDHGQQPLPFLHLQPFCRFPSYVIRLRDSGGHGPTLPLPVLPVTRRTLLTSPTAGSW